ncbi:glycosyl transferase family protein [Moritella dasanensis]|uniref:glycosyl transferase family protein n=1 Tax=Moritella dasanensis TaxID=428031 RepID=UPI0002E887E2|nr:glycosyl transferase family protein [Moritella dasanensis]
MSWIDVFVTYLFSLKYLVYGLAIILLISGIDDFFIDICHWTRHFYRKFFVYDKHKFHDYEGLYDAPEKPLAIMVPAWQEHGVVGPMAELAAKTLDYENYHIFVGTYPNDPQTQEEVDQVCARFPNVHKVVCARPGPTSKADCLNNIAAAIFLFEAQAKFEFAGFILHDSEDVVSTMELRLYNHLVNRKDLIQLPVYPYTRKWTDFTSGHYIDEFAELHGKDVPVREAIAGQVPSAGVGTCFSRRAISMLLREGDGIAFDIQSLTEDYDIGIRIKEHGMEEIFVRYPVVTPEHEKAHSVWSGKNLRESSVICIREYFPDTFNTAVRQKSRWIVGIVFQGMKNHAWSKSWSMNYFLCRDRKGGITNLVGFIAVLVFTQLGIIWLVQSLSDDPYHFLSIYGDEPWLSILLKINAFFLINRIFQRFIFVKAYYGWMQGFLSMPRMVWGNIVNFFANIRALRQVIEMGDARRVAWDKTTHDFPHLDDERSARKAIGQILIDLGAITEIQLDKALKDKPQGQRLGRYLLNNQLVTSESLVKAVAEQAEVDYQNIEPLNISGDLITLISKGLAWRYGIVAINYKSEQGVMLASEEYLSPVSLAAISRQLKCQVSYIIAYPGQVQIALKAYYSGERFADPTAGVERFEQLDKNMQQQVWHQYVEGQWSLLEILSEYCNISPQVMNQILIGYEKSALTLNDYLLDKEVISIEELDTAIALQVKREPNLAHLVTGALNA